MTGAFRSCTGRVRRVAFSGGATENYLLSELRDLPLSLAMILDQEFRTKLESVLQLD
jgi:hypothetical protein